MGENTKYRYWCEIIADELPEEEVQLALWIEEEQVEEETPEPRDTDMLRSSGVL